MEYKVLIIDDEPWSRQVVKSLVQWEKLNLIQAGEAEDAHKGIKLISEVQPHIIVTDMRMPGMSGNDFLKILEDKFPQIKIIVLSGYDDFSYLQQALRSGAVDYLLKPVDPDDLNRILEKCIQELDAREKEKLEGNSIIFNDPILLDQYIKHRKRVFGHLLELDKSAVKESIEELHRFLTDSGKILLNRDLGARILHDFILILEEFTTRFGLDAQSLESLSPHKEKVDVDQVFSTMTMKYEKTIDSIKEYRNKKGFLNLIEVKEHIDRYYQEQLSLETVSKLFLVTKEHMSRSFKKTFGITLNEYITTLRMEKARSLIVNEGVEIKQAAFLCGYTDLAYFYRVFKKQFAMPPGLMRR